MCNTCINTINTNTGQYDPTRTLTLRNMFANKMKGKFRTLRGSIRTAVTTQDVFGLVNPLVQSVPSRKAFEFLTSKGKIEAFMVWLQQQVDAGVLEISNFPTLGTALSSHWTDMYIQTAYRTGISRAYTEMKKAGYSVPDMEDLGGLNTIFSMPIHADRVGILFARVFSDLKGITDAMDMQISRVLAQGMADGKSPILIAKELTRTISGPVGDLGLTDTLGRFIPAQRRAEMLARTEIIRAHHQGMVNTYESFGIEGVFVKAELITAGDSSVCIECADLEGIVFTLAEIRNVIPVHPLCRCISLPVDMTNRKK